MRDYGPSRQSSTGCEVMRSPGLHGKDGLTLRIQTLRSMLREGGGAAFASITSMRATIDHQQHADQATAWVNRWRPEPSFRHSVSRELLALNYKILMIDQQTPPTADVYVDRPLRCLRSTDGALWVTDGVSPVHGSPRGRGLFILGRAYVAKLRWGLRVTQIETPRPDEGRGVSRSDRVSARPLSWRLPDASTRSSRGRARTPWLRRPRPRRPALR
jgi:hypothetical protein